jgi:hypothetical protein
LFLTCQPADLPCPSRTRRAQETVIVIDAPVLIEVPSSSSDTRLRSFRYSRWKSATRCHIDAS